MTDEQRQEMMRLQFEGARAMSNEELARRQAEAVDSMRQRGPLSRGEQEAMSNFWRKCEDAALVAQPTQSPPKTLWQRFRAWRERTGFFMDGHDGGMWP